VTPTAAHVAGDDPPVPTQDISASIMNNNLELNPLQGHPKYQKVRGWAGRTPSPGGSEFHPFPCKEHRGRQRQVPARMHARLSQRLQRRGAGLSWPGVRAR